MSTKTGVAHTAVAASTGMGKAIGELKPLELMPLKLAELATN